MSNRNVAVFIDAENLFKGYGKLEIPDVSMSEILDQLEAATSREAGAGSIAVSRAYADWNALGLEDYRRDVERSGVQTVQVFSAGIASKNAADIELVVDCLRSAADMEQLEVFVIVSGDGDFVPLVRRLHELDKYVVGATLSGHGLNSLLEREVDQYVALTVGPPPPVPTLAPMFSADVERAAAPQKAATNAPGKTADKTAGRTSQKSAPVAEPAPAKTGKKPAKKAANKAEPKTEPAPAKTAKKTAAKPAKKRVQEQAPAKASAKPNWHAMAKKIPVVHAGRATSPQDYKAVIKKVLSDSQVRSFCDQLANHGGTLPILAMAIKAAAPALSPSDARVSSLSRALRFALADTQYALARESDDVQPVLVRRTTDPRGMLSDLSLDDIERGVQ